MNYNKIPNYPESVSAANVLCRLIDGLSFRYYWATEGLREEDLSFSPSESSWTLNELLKHIYDLAFVTDMVLQNQAFTKTKEIFSFDKTRKLTLELFAKNRNDLIKMSDDYLSNCTLKPKGKNVEFPFWHIINGPLADALTHVGQINSWRRIAGNPVPSHNPFTGT